MDAINPNDMAIPLIREGGVTSSQVLPGSGNVMGGEGVVVKLRGKDTQEMLLCDGPRTLKMACGENPTRVYGSRGQLPMSRMGSGWVMRDMFEKAYKQKRAQEQWCSKPSPDGDFPISRELDGLTSLLRGTALLQAHCYTSGDIETLLRIADEFEFKVTAVHHALEAYKLASLLARRQITTATFADMFLFKMEAYEGSVHAAASLSLLNTEQIDSSERWCPTLLQVGPRGYIRARPHL